MYNLNHLLNALEFDIGKEGSIVFKDNFNSTTDEIGAKLEILAPDAVYFFDSNPYILFYDFSSSNSDKSRISNFHKQSWCFDKAPLVFAIFPNAIEVYNAFEFSKSQKLKKLNLPLSQIIEQFSFWKLQSGESWKWYEQQFKIKNNNRVSQKLFDNIKELREILTDDNKLESSPLKPHEANIFILRLIFARYLIDRNVSIEGYIDGNDLDKRRTSFNNLIADKVKINAFFEHLKGRFHDNDLFKDKIDISTNQLEYLSRIFSGEIRKGNTQLFLFDVFDFNIIPVETISGIYESVIDPVKRKENAAVYTPPFLVDYILKETVDKNIKQGKSTKILDPACGSGIFLVQAFRRMVYALPPQKRTKDNLIEIAQNNLFGIDKDINALNVAVFSVYVAILDFIQPVEIIDVHLPKLKGKNLFRNDFFNEEDVFFDDDKENFDRFNEILNPPNKESFKTFDFILGNPPWGKKNDKEKDELHQKYINKYGLPITGGEIAQTFLYRSKDFMAENTVTAMIVTSKAFYNDSADNFKNHFLNKFFVDKFFDLSPVRHIVFKDADYPACIIICRNAIKKSISDHEVEFLSLKPNLFLKNFQALVIDNQDIKQIKQQDLIDKKWAFKAALYGSRLDFLFLKRLERESISIKNFLDSEFGRKNFTAGDGILKGNQKKFYLNLIGKPVIDSDNLKLFFTPITENTNILNQNDANLESGRKPSLFEGEHCYLRATPYKEETVFVSYCDQMAVHKHDIFGISTTSQFDKIKELYGVFNSNLYLYYMLLTSSSFGIGRPNARLREYFSFPIFEEDFPKLVEAVDEFINVYKSIYTNDSFWETPIPEKESIPSFHRINEIIEEIYDINDIEKSLIDYSLKITRYQFIPSKEKKYNKKATDNDYKQYAKTFYNHFYHIFKHSDSGFRVRIFKLQYFTAMQFLVSDGVENSGVSFEEDYSEKEVFDLLARNFSISKISSEIFVNRRIRGFDKKFFYIIKPNDMKSWHKAIAYADLSEFDKAIAKSSLKKIREEEYA